MAVGPAEVSRPLGVAEVATRLGVHRDTVKRGIPPEELPFFRTPGGHRRYRPDDVDAYLARRRER